MDSLPRWCPSTTLGRGFGCGLDRFSDPLYVSFTQVSGSPNRFEYGRPVVVSILNLGPRGLTTLTPPSTVSVTVIKGLCVRTFSVTDLRLPPSPPDSRRVLLRLSRRNFLKEVVVPPRGPVPATTSGLFLRRRE